MNRRRFLGGLLMATLAPDAMGKRQARRWSLHTDLSLATDRYFDGDSFHFRQFQRRKVHHFRLYGADCPELDDVLSEERLEEQTRYFNRSKDQVQAYAQVAKERTAQLLSGALKIYTQGQDARGMSESPRMYAYIFTSQGSLGELLIQEGLARAHGYWSDFQGDSWTQIRARYRRLEAQAKASQLGLWSKA